MRLQLVFCGLAWAALTTCAQDANEQLWLDFELGRVRAQWTFTTELSGRTLLSGDEAHWTSLNLSPTLERSMTANWDLILGLPLSYTTQTDDITSAGVDIQLGTRFLFTPRKRVQTNLTIRYEQRYLTTYDPGATSDNSSRTRIRAEVRIPLDTRNYYADTMWYLMADCEAFIALDPDLNERFANRLRSRLGLGRKFSYNWRAELIYTFQTSQRAISDGALTYDNIFRVRVKYYFSRPDQKREPSDGGF